LFIGRGSVLSELDFCRAGKVFSGTGIKAEIAFFSRKKTPAVGYRG
jgi:hypothetical protein